MRTELFRHYESLDFEFHARNSVGKLLTVLSNDLNQMTELFHHAPEDLLMTGIKFIGAFVIMGKIHLPLTLLLFLYFRFLVFLHSIQTGKWKSVSWRAEGDLQI